MAAGSTRHGVKKKQKKTPKQNTTSIIEANIYSHLFIQMSLLAKEISQRRWVVSFASSELSGMWQYPLLHFKASITRHHKPMVILPSSFCVDMFTRPLACCRCDQFLLWYEVTVKICQCLSVKTALSCLRAKKKRSPFKTCQSLSFLLFGN